MIGRSNTGGGGGGLSPRSAVIHVTAPVGSTISFSKGGVVAKVLGPEKSHVNADDNTLADWYYSVSSSNYGEWTVTATLGTETASDTVIVDSASEYDVVLSYQLYIVQNGYFANGFSFPNNLRRGATPTITENVSGSLRIVMPISTSTGGATNLIDLSSYSALVVEADVHVQYGCDVGIYPSYDYSSLSALESAAIAKLDLSNTTTAINTLDISEINRSAHLGVALFADTGGGYVNIKNLWLS